MSNCNHTNKSSTGWCRSCYSIQWALDNPGKSYQNCSNTKQRKNKTPKGSPATLESDRERHHANKKRRNEQRKAWAQTTFGKYRVFSGNAYRRAKGEIEFLEYASIVFPNECYYCSGALPAEGAGVDRKDSSLPYSYSNCVPCCRSCNTQKGQKFSFEEFVKLKSSF